MKRAARALLIACGFFAAAWMALRIASARRRSTEAAEIPFAERRSVPDPEAMQAMTTGNLNRIGLDLSKLQEMEEGAYRPVVQYLTAIQVKRGEEGETLLFVRKRDLDALAELAGDDPDSFVDQFKELGIILSMN